MRAESNPRQDGEPPHGPPGPPLTRSQSTPLVMVCLRRSPRARGALRAFPTPSSQALQATAPAAQARGWLTSRPAQPSSTPTAWLPGLSRTTLPPPLAMQSLSPGLHVTVAISDSASLGPSPCQSSPGVGQRPSLAHTLPLCVAEIWLHLGPHLLPHICLGGGPCGCMSAHTTHMCTHLCWA